MVQVLYIWYVLLLMEIAIVDVFAVVHVRIQNGYACALRAIQLPVFLAPVPIWRSKKWQSYVRIYVLFLFDDVVRGVCKKYPAEFKYGAFSLFVTETFYTICVCVW